MSNLPLGFAPIRKKKPVYRTFKGIPLGFEKPLREQYETKLGSKSVFHVVINTNIADKKLSADEKSDMIARFKNAVYRLKKGILSKEYVKFGGDGYISLFEFNLEVGEIVNRIHLDGIIVIDTFTLLEFQPIREMLKEELGKVAYFNVRSVKDHISILQNYSRKQDLIKII